MPRDFAPRFRPTPLALALGLLMTLSFPASVQAQTNPAQIRQQEYDLPAGPLAASLNRISRDAGLTLTVDAATIGNRQAAPVKGRMGAEQALRQALSGSGLELIRTDLGSYTLRPIPTAKNEPVLPAVNVKAALEGETAWGPVHGYVARRTATGTKTDTPLAEIPQVVTVVTRDQMDDQGAPSLQDALRYSAGVVSARGINLTDDSFNLRGFAAGLATTDTAVYRDGMRQALGIYASTVEPYGLERVEVLKGPASVLFGQVAPGGVINVVTKRPSQEPLHEVQFQTGSYNRRQVGVDLGGPVDAQGEWSYRLTAMTRDADSMTDHIPDRRTYIAPALTWRPSTDTSLTLLASYQETRTAYNWGLPVAGTAKANPLGELPRNLFTGEPGFDKWETKTSTVGYLLEHRFNETWNLRQNLRYYRSEMVWNSAYGSGLQANQRLLNRFAYMRNDEYQALTVDNQMEAKWRHGEFEHTSLIGIDYLNAPATRKERRGTVAALDLYAPVYGATVTPNANLSRNADTSTIQTGLYAQEQLKYQQHWVFLVGLRQDWARSSTKDLLAKTITSQQQSALTGRTGVVYLFDNGLSPYVSYAKSFEPATGTDFNGKAFNPLTGKQTELGLKYQPLGSNSSVTAALFDLRRSNVLTTDPDPAHIGYQVQTGEIRSRGLELEAATKVGKNLDLLASYAHTDAKVTKSNGADLGTVPSGVPKQTIALWARYSFNTPELQGLQIGAGVRRIMGTSGYVLGSTPTPDKLPDYSVVDALVAYDTGAWRAALNVNNLFDKKYIQSCYYATTTCFYGAERSAVASLTLRW